MRANDGGPSTSNAQCSLLLVSYRALLLELFSHFCGSATSKMLSLSGWLAFADAFDVCPGYLSAERLEEVYEDALKGGGRRPTGGAASGKLPASTMLSFDAFLEALCLLSKAVSDKQWKVEYSAEKAARYRYTYKDAEKGRVAPGADEMLEGVLLALGLDEPSAMRERAGMPAAPAVLNKLGASANEAAPMLRMQQPNQPPHSSSRAQSLWRRNYKCSASRSRRATTTRRTRRRRAMRPHHGKRSPSATSPRQAALSARTAPIRLAPLEA